MYVYVYIYIYIANLPNLPKCGKWDYGGLKMWEVGLWGSKNVGSGTLGSNKCGKWDFQDAVSLCFYIQMDNNIPQASLKKLHSIQ